METSSAVPQGFGVVSWPVRMLEDFQIRIADWRASKYYPDDPLSKSTKTIGETLEPWYDSLQRIKTAYQIIGYEYLRTQPKGSVASYENASTLRHQLETADGYQKDIDTVRLRARPEGC
jgi:hypothetical protein